MNSRAKKILLLFLAAILLVGVGQVQKALNDDRDKLGLTRVSPLENAPPVLAFTTVALGGFRGLISNALWIRANELQEEDKFFEMAQLADWITKLEPHFAQVWVVQAWNMAYNISVKFKDYSDRWNWVQRGIELLRDDGLRYNPNEMLLYRELAGFFQHKMGANLDDANMYYKRAWFDEMNQIFKPGTNGIAELAEPANDEARLRAQMLHEKYKIDTKFLQEVDARYGPLEWRLPEAHAIYWAARGLKQAKNDALRVNQDDLLQLHRMIYQSMQIAVARGRAITNRDGRLFDLASNFLIIRKANDAYEQAIKEEDKNRDSVAVGHKNFLRDVVYYLYTDNREAEASEWFDYLCTRYPNKSLLEARPESLPGTLTLYEYVFGRVEELVNDISRDKTKLILERALRTSYIRRAVGEDDSADGWESFAKKIWVRYKSKTKDTGERVDIPPLDEIRKDVLLQLIDPERGALAPELAARLRASLNIPAPTNNAPQPQSAPHN